MALEHLLLIPFGPTSGWSLEPGMRRGIGAQFTIASTQALTRFETSVGRPLRPADPVDPPRFMGKSFVAARSRSLAAIALSTHLEAAGLDLATLDPGTVEITWRRTELERRAHLDPLTIGTSTTFVLSDVWVASLIRVKRWCTFQSS